jgi:phosphatidylglycerophosphate synthase
MPKLSAEEKFLDLSDYGRAPAVAISRLLVSTPVTPVHVTLLFGLCGLVAIFMMLNGHYLAAGALLILKSILDAADGELARVRQTPSYTGRYLDSVFDILLNFFILLAIVQITGQPLWLMLLAFFGLQLQGTLYNYYYVILRHRSVHGDKTSKIFETKTPSALPGESQLSVTLLYHAYRALYSLFDRIIYRLDRGAPQNGRFPRWFMTLTSVYGLGFQLLLMALLLGLNRPDWILPLFAWLTGGIFGLILIRRGCLVKNGEN